MIRVTCLRLVVAGLLATALAGRSDAQAPPMPIGPQRPTFSPYLNLLRTDSIPAVNYYGIVRPQIAFQNSLFSVRQQLYTLQQSAQPIPQGPPTRAPALPITGQPVTFLNTGGYFMNHGSAARPGEPSQPTGAVPPSAAPTRLGGRTR